MRFLGSAIVLAAAAVPATVLAADLSKPAAPQPQPPAPRSPWSAHVAVGGMMMPEFPGSKDYQYMPFGAGPRICIGAAFAQQALRLILPTLLQRARIAVVRGHDVSRLTRANILMPRFGLRVYLQAPHRRRLRAEPICGDVREMVELPGC